MPAPILGVLAFSVLSSVSDIMIDSVVDSTADMLLSSAQNYLATKYPNDGGNSFMNTLIGQMRMGVMARTQASFMMSASSVNSKINQKIVGGIDSYKSKLQQQKVNNGGMIQGAVRGIAKGKINDKVDKLSTDYENSQYRLLNSIHQVTTASANEAHAFGNGVGSLKSAYVQSKNQFNQVPKMSMPELKQILNGMGYFSAPQGV